jgi:opacity protein-like surface antigen
MKKLVLFGMFCFALLSSNESKAQVSGSVTAGLLKFSDIDPMFGWNLAGKYNVNDDIRVGLNLGRYTVSFFEDAKFFIMTITGLFEYSFSEEKISPYAGIDLGLYRSGISGGSVTLSSTSFGFAPAAGLNFGINDNLSLNANAKYNVILFEGESDSAFGLNAGVVYKF